MRLTWKDAVATVFMGGIVAVYAAFVLAAGWPVVTSVRGTAAAILVLGFVGGCALGAAGPQYGKATTWRSDALVGVATVLGVTALVTGVYALVTASAMALAVLFGATIALWLTATVRHLVTKPPRQLPGGRDAHEVIDPYSVTPK